MEGSTISVAGVKGHELKALSISVWQLSQDSQASVHNNLTVLRFEGLLEPQRLDEAPNTVIVSHDVLRSAISVEGEIPHPSVPRGGRLRLRVVDLAGDSDYARQLQLGSLVEEERQERFDLTSDLKIRATLAWLGKAQSTPEGFCKSIAGNPTYASR